MRCFLLIAFTLKTIFALEEAVLTQKAQDLFSGSTHTNNWAVLVCTSRYWFNYRHIANALSLYRSVKRLGIPDSQIILMLADDMACNPRNPRPGTVYNNENEAIDLYGSSIEVDYRGYEVTAENFIRVLTGRLSRDTPRSKRLVTDDRSNVLVYMTGHGGEDFLKFQDSEEISSVELADAFEQMWQKRRYNELLFIIDTCQAVSMLNKFYSPNLIGIASSQIGEDSLSHHADPAIGVYIIDRYTYYLLEFLEKTKPGSKTTMSQLFKVCPKHQCISTPGFSTHLFHRNVDDALISDFFGNVRAVDLSDHYFPIAIDDTSFSESLTTDGAILKDPSTFSKVDQFYPGGYSRSTVTSSPHPYAGMASSLLLLVIVVAICTSLIRSNKMLMQ